MNDLFDQNFKNLSADLAPLAEKMRPNTLDEVVGQENILGKNGPLRILIKKDQIPSLILWGPPGTGKTTLAQVIAKSSHSHFISLSAVLSGVKDLRKAVEEAQEKLKFHQQKSIVFIDEIHRFNKSQQDALLPHLEKGTFTLIGATTENPSFEIISPLLSRCRVFVLKPLNEIELNQLIDRALKKIQREEKNNAKINPKARSLLVSYAQGDARRLLNTLEVAASLGSNQETIELGHIADASQQKTLLYDKTGDKHYDLISALIKSMRNSDPDASIYYLARMYEAGEDPRFLARRMVIFASEDVGLADPQALSLALSAQQAYELVGRAEGWIPLSQAAIYLALAPKSNASYQAYKNAKLEIEQSGPLEIPLHLRNAPTQVMKQLGYGKGYRYVHEDPKAQEEMNCLPEKLIGRHFFKKEANKP